MRSLPCLLLLALVLTACAPGMHSFSAALDSGAGSSPAAASSADITTARAQIDQLVVAAPHPKAGYDRAEFLPHGWIAQPPVAGQHGCNTREIVLTRQSTGPVTYGKDCNPATGQWTSPYDGVTYTKATALQIDHLVPLGDAWISGADRWTAQQRSAFANDLVDPQLIAVTGKLNEQKQDSSPDAWKPPSRADWPAYAADWVLVKVHYHLTVTAPELTALKTMLG